MSQRSRERFLKACGLSDTVPFHVELEGPVEGQIMRRAFARPFAVVGRDPGADLVLDHEQVNVRHAYLQVIAGRVFCVDLGSRTGIAWEKGPERSGCVDRNSGIRIGPFQIRAGAGMGMINLGNPLTAQSLGETESAGPALNLEFPQRNRRPPWGVSRVLTLVGRSSWCRLGLTHAEVSNLWVAKRPLSGLRHRFLRWFRARGTRMILAPKKRSAKWTPHYVVSQPPLLPSLS